MKVLEFLNEKKTAIGAFLLLLLSLNSIKEWLPDDIETIILYIVQSWTGVGIIHKVQKSIKKIKKKNGKGK